MAYVVMAARFLVVANSVDDLSDDHLSKVPVVVVRARTDVAGAALCARLSNGHVF